MCGFRFSQLEVRVKILKQLKNLEEQQNEYDDKLKQSVENQAEYDALMSKTVATTASSTKKKPQPESDTDETTATSTASKAKEIFDTFMKRWQTDVLAGRSDEQ